MDGQVKEARGQQLQSLDLHPVVEEVGIWYEGVGTMILEEIDHLDDSDWAWREQDTTLKVKSRSVWNGIEEWAEYDKKFPAVLFPFQCEFEVLMSYEFYTNYVFKGTPPPNPKNGEGDALRGWFPIQRDKFDQGRGLVMSDLPFHLMISDKVRGREKEEMKEREEKTELSNSFTPLPPTDALALPLETTCETLSLESHDQTPSVEHSPPPAGKKEEGHIRVEEEKEIREGRDLPPNGTEERGIEKREEESFSIESLPPKGALTQEEKGGGENEKRGTESCSIESSPPPIAPLPKKRREELKRKLGWRKKPPLNLPAAPL